jgi:hypothetical protein
MYLNNNGSFSIFNRFQLYDNDEKNPTTTQIDGYQTSEEVTYSEWTHKYDAIKVTEGQTIAMNDDVYDSSHNKITTDAPTSFDIQTDDYQYYVVVNKDGIVNVDQATITDTLSNNMDFVGYLKVEVYCDSNHDDFDKDIASHIDPADEDNPTKIVWLAVDDSKTFSFKPTDLGITDTCSIVLSYYVRPSFGDNLKVDISNSINIQGSVGSGNGWYTLSPGAVSVSTQAFKTNNCNVKKDSWYYVRERGFNDTEALPESWDKGGIYWILKVSGTKISIGNAFRDQVVNDSYLQQAIVEDGSFVGVYNVVADSSYDSIADLRNDEKNTKITDYKLDWDSNNQYVDVTFTNDITIDEGREIYIIIRTKLITRNSGNNSINTYANSVYQKFSENGQFSLTASPTTYTLPRVANKFVAKDATSAFDYDGNGGYSKIDVTAYPYNLDPDNYKYQNTNILKYAGTYIEYTIYGCIYGTADGDDVIFSDTLPEGLELAYLRIRRLCFATAKTVDIEELNNDRAWTRYAGTPNHSENSNYSSDTTPCIYYYNETTREIRWKFDDVSVLETNGYFSNGTKCNYVSALTFQLVCKVVDTDILMGIGNNSGEKIAK